MKKIFLGITALCLIASAHVILSYANGQPDEQLEMKKSLNELMGQNRNQQPLSIRPEDLEKTYGVKLIPYLDQYREDESERVRWQAYAMLWSLGVDSSTLPIDRQKIVDLLVEGMADESPLINQYIPHRLLSFKASYFSEESKDLLRKYLSGEKSLMLPEGRFDYYGVILVIGAADIRSELKFLEKFLTDESKYEEGPHVGRWYGTISWAARKARARMGVESDINRCIELIEAEPDPVKRVTILLKDLAYVRQPATIAVLQKYLESEEMLPSDDERMRSKFNQYAAWGLSNILDGFPVKEDGPSFSDQDIELCRRWMSEQKSWKIIR